jgi:hypothetical protein
LMSCWARDRRSLCAWEQYAGMGTIEMGMSRGMGEAGSFRGAQAPRCNSAGGAVLQEWCMMSATWRMCYIAREITVGHPQ